MKYYTFTLLIFLFPLFAFSQEDPYTIEQKQVEDGIKFYCENNSDVTTEVTLELLEYKNIKGYSEPVTKRVTAGMKRLLLEIGTKKGYSYRYQTSYKQTPTSEEQVNLNEKKLALLLVDFPNINQGIVVFDKSGCTRCSYATSYLTDKGIDFRIIDVSKAGKNNDLMWTLVKKDGHKDGEKILTPIFLVNGELSHTHKDLRVFLEGL